MVSIVLDGVIIDMWWIPDGADIERIAIGDEKRSRRAARRRRPHPWEKQGQAVDDSALIEISSPARRSMALVNVRTLETPERNVPVVLCVDPRAP